MIFEPSHSFTTDFLKQLGFKGQVTIENFAKCVLLVNKGSFADRRTYNIAGIICGVWGADVPWFWHLTRVVATYDATSFDNEEWVGTFANWYMDFVNKIEQEVFDTTGTYIGFAALKHKVAS